MSLENQRQRRKFMGLLGASALAGLAGCGGGGSAASGPLRQALSAPPQVTREDAPRRRDQVYQRQGITAIVTSADGTAVGVAHTDGRVLLLDGQGHETLTLQPTGSAVCVGLVFAADGRVLVGVDRNSVALGWGVDSGVRHFMLRGHDHGLRAVAAGAKGAVVVTGGEGARVLAWDGSNGQLRQVMHAGDFINALSVSPDGRLVASGGADARVLVWETASGKSLLTLLGHAGEVSAVSFSPDGRQIASAGDDGKVLIWDVAAGRQMLALAGQRAPLRSLAFNADGSLLAGGGQDGQVLVWDSATHAVLQDLTGSTTAVNALAFDRLGRNQLLAGNEDSQLLSWALPARGGR